MEVKINEYVKKESMKILATGLLVFILSPWSSAADMVKQQSIVVTTSMLACAVNDVIPQDKTFHIISILPPGACPGHFDLKPDVLPHLQQAALVIRHDYQADLENKIKQISEESVHVNAIQLPGSLLIPDQYSQLTEKITNVLIECYPRQEKKILKKKKECHKKIENVKQLISNNNVSWKEQPVIAAVRQNQFASYLGLNVIGILKRTEEMTPLDMKKLMQAEATMIIGNYQSGPDAAEALGKRMHLPVAILSNFPDTTGYGKGYQELIEHNIEKINQAWSQK